MECVKYTITKVSPNKSHTFEESKQNTRLVLKLLHALLYKLFLCVPFTAHYRCSPTKGYGLHAKHHASLITNELTKFLRQQYDIYSLIGIDIGRLMEAIHVLSPALIIFIDTCLEIKHNTKFVRQNNTDTPMQYSDFSTNIYYYSPCTCLLLNFLHIYIWWQVVL